MMYTFNLKVTGAMKIVSTKKMNPLREVLDDEVLEDVENATWHIIEKNMLLILSLRTAQRLQIQEQIKFKKVGWFSSFITNSSSKQFTRYFHIKKPIFDIIVASLMKQERDWARKKAESAVGSYILIAMKDKYQQLSRGVQISIG
eukprot:TRINITY_DN8083_c0_g1_i1.p1 TRINITY_DN8083_c0_g1~~TRINITY_DN8083_c0_g1_i1.p1  ORF type:complete len:145 (-),score=18.30 TRINITY_DN8083_c0_g1_i1:600-1034(-)